MGSIELEKALNKQNVTINLDPELIRQARKAALDLELKRGSLSQIIDQALRHYLEFMGLPR